MMMRKSGQTGARSVDGCRQAEPRLDLVVPAAEDPLGGMAEAGARGRCRRRCDSSRAASAVSGTGCPSATTQALGAALWASSDNGQHAGLGHPQRGPGAVLLAPAEADVLEGGGAFLHVAALQQAAKHGVAGGG